MSYQHQHVGNHDDVGLAPGRHGRLKVVLSVFPVGHGEVGMKRDVVLPDGLPGKKKNKNTRDKRSNGSRSGSCPGLAEPSHTKI